MKVPTITAVRIAILIASFAFIFTMGVFLLFLGYLASDRPSQVTLLKQSACQTFAHGPEESDQ
jgi:hypothetical protein